MSSEGKSSPGLILGIKNPRIRERCAEQLQLLKRLIETRGFDSESDFRILRMVYGDSAMACITFCSVATYYSSCLIDSKLAEDRKSVV
jgi:hypothetical protein